jgi:PAS domain S-box-containing protein
VDRERLRLAIDASGVATWDFYPRTGLLIWDARCRELHGLSPDAPVDYDTFVAALHPDDRDRVNEEVARAIDPSSTGEYRIEYRIVRLRDRTPRWISVLGRVFFEEGRAVRFIGTSLDITERKEAEVERQRLLHQAEEALRVRDVFLTVASHELRTPLMPLRLNLQMVQRALGTRQPEQHLPECIEVALRQVDRLSRLVEDMLDVARGRPWQITIQTTEVDMAKLCADVAARFADLASRARCTIELRASPLAIARIDPARIEQVVEHLLSNAIKYGAGAPITLRVEPRPGRVVVAVEDHGIGIAPDAQEKIFGLFVHAASELRYGGLGLGLYIARQIVEAHGGRISCSSRPGAGATFEVDLPTGPTARQEAA